MSAPADQLPPTLPEAHALIASLQQKLQESFWRVQQLEKQLYGASSERRAEENLSKEQILMSLFPPPAQRPATQEVLVKADDKPAPARPRRHPAAEKVETVTERIEPEEKVCPHCGKDKCEIGCEKSERYEYIPARVVRHEIVRPKLACPCGQGQVSIAPLPPTLIEQGMAGPGLVAHLLLSKFDDHQPLCRQQKHFERLGVTFARQTLCDWIEKGALALEPIVRLMKQELLSGDYLQVDETPVRVMDPEVKGRCATGYLWVEGVPGGDVIFEFHPGRGKEYARKLLGNFRGYLQRDGYSAYGSLVNEDKAAMIPVGGWSHARRKFVEAAELENSRALEIVSEIRKVYLIERHARDQCLGADGRLKLRQEMAKPVLLGLKPQLEALRERHLPQSPLGKACRYALNEWEALTRYLEDGRLEIDNNLTENAIRPSALGKKNWLFIGHPDAGWRSAVIYSIIVSCRRRGIDPWQYVRDVFQRLPAMKQADLPSLLPRYWKPTTL